MTNTNPAESLPAGHPDRPTPPEMIRRKAYSVDESRLLLGGISRASIYELINSGELQTVMLCGRRLVPEQAIDELLRESMRKQRAAA